VDAIKPIDYSEIRANRPYCLLFWGLAMTEILKGNFKPARPVDVTPAQETLDDRFEREVKKRLGGSIAYVAKKKVLWDIKE
jgi:hypothetical protein